MLKFRFRKKTIYPIIAFVVVAAVVFVNLSRENNPAPENQAMAAGWYDYDWNHRKQITIDHTKVSAVLTDFPVLVNLTTNADLATYAQDDGDDIVFTNSDGSTKLSHEIEKFNGDTGELIAWVKIPSLSNVTDTEVYLYYENPDATNQENITDVWSNGYTGVWHLPDGTNLDPNDSSPNGNNGTIIGSTAAVGKIDGAANFAASGDRINVGSWNSGTTSITLSSWVNPSTTSFNTWQAILSKGDNTFRLCICTATLYCSVGSTLGAATFHVNQGTGVGQDLGSTIPLQAGTWYHVVATLGDGVMKIFVNGVEDVSLASAQSIAQNANEVDIGNNSGQLARNWKGGIDHSYVSTSARSAEWIATEYNNQNSPSTFYSLDSAEELETTPPTNPTTFKAYSSSAKTLGFTSGGWVNALAPYFEWSGATDDISGVDGYYLYLGTSDTANPEETSGIIEADNSPHYTTSTNFTPSEDMVEGETYYFRIKTKDNAQNVSAAATTFTYSLDSQAPDPPEYINVSPVGCSTTNDFTFSWLAATDNGASNIAGYQYKKGSTGEIQSISGLELSETAYQDSDNVLYLRSIDNAGNTSSWQTAVYCTVEAASLTSGPDVVAHPSSLVITWRSSKETTSHVEVYDGNTYLSEFGLNSYSTEHTITVLGLKAERPYRYRLSWKDSGGNISYSNWYETVTAKAPQVENLEVKSISATSMLVSFSTNYSATAVLQYGKNSYDQTIQFDNLASYFSTVIEKLDQGTDYKLRVVANTNDGTEFAAGESFSTPPLPSVSTLNFRTITDKSAVAVEVSWTTNIETTSSVFYRQGSDSFKEVSSSEKTLNHKLEIGNLEDNTIYDIYVTGTDQYGNQTRSATRRYTTPEDTRPPTITDIVIETSNVGIGKEDKAQAAISYSTDESAKCLIEYAEGISGDNYSNKTPNDETMSNSHLTILSDLTPQTPYHFRIICSDKANNQSESSDQTVISGEITPSVFNIILKTLYDLFGWLGRVI